GATDAGHDAAVTLYPLTTGDSCFDVLTVANVMDGCGIAPGSIVGAALSVNYTMTATTGTLTVGTMGAEGAGPIANNTGTLTRDGDTSDSTMPLCTWHQMDTAQVTLTGSNAFTLTVTEVETNLSAACGATAPNCTSTWTWTMKKGSKTPPTCQ
ncbi:MAG TPA: hypothetical protein VGD55_12105, partial [Acidothermaceae bacterium]